MTILTLYARNMRQFPRIPTVLVFGVMMPVIQLLLFGSIFSSLENTPAFQMRYPAEQFPDLNYYGYIAPAIILLTTFLGMANSSAAFIVDLRTGYFDKLRTTPANPSSVIAARLGAEMTRVLAQAILILGLAFLLGARVATGVLGAVVILLAAVVFSALTSGLIAVTLAMRTKSDQATQSAFPLFFIFLFLSTAYVPKEGLPNWLQTVVGFNPIDYLIQGLRALMLEGWSEAGSDLAIAFASMAGVSLLLIFAAWRAFRKLTD